MYIIIPETLGMFYRPNSFKGIKFRIGVKRKETKMRKTPTRHSICSMVWSFTRIELLVVYACCDHFLAEPIKV